MYKVLILAITLGLSLHVVSQPALIISHVKKDREVTYNIGDHIRLQLLSEKLNKGGYIEAVTDSFIVLTRTLVFEHNGSRTENQYRENIPIHDIRRIYKEKDNAWAVCRRFYYMGSVVIGSALISMTILNTFINFIPPPFGAFIFVAGVLVSGIIIKYAGMDHYRIGKKWEIETNYYPYRLETHR